VFPFNNVFPFNRLQKLISQLEILGETIYQEDINLKFLRSLPSEWKTYILIWRNKVDLEEQSLDDLFNNLKIYEAEVKDLKKINPDDLEEMNLKWQMAMLTIRARRFLKRTGRNLGANGTDTFGFDMFKVECYNCHRRGYFSKECRSLRDNRNKKTTRRTVPAEVSTSNALVSQGSLSSSGSDNKVAPCSKACSKAFATLRTHYDNLTVEFRKSQLDVLSYKTGLELVKARLVVYQKNETVFKEDIKLLKHDVMLKDNALAELRKKFEKAKKERNDLKLTLDKFQTSSKNLSKLLESQVCDKTGLEFDSQVFNSQVFDCEEFHSHESDNRVSKNPENDRYKTSEGYHDVPPPYTGKPDLVFTDDHTASESIANVFNVESSTNTPSQDMSKTLSQVSDCEEFHSHESDNRAPKNLENDRNKPGEGTNKPSKDMSKSHRLAAPIIKDWISDSEDETEIKSVLTKKEPSFVTSTEHVKSSRKSIKKVEHYKQAANLRTNNQKSRGHKTNWNNKACFVCRSLNHLIKDYDGTQAYVEQCNEGESLKFSNPQQALKDKCVIDSGCSRHMTRNISFLLEFEEIDGGYVAFGGNPKGGKITGKGKIKTGMLDFDNVYFVKELKFNLFSVS
nr:hypothetical protein [Tanacetum cinerariifolium]